MPEYADDEILSAPEACEFLRIKDRTLRKWIKEKGIPHAKIGGVLRFRKSALVEWVKSYEQAGGPTNE